MVRDEDITVESFAYHRNGIAGEPFYAVLFRFTADGNEVGELFYASIFHDEDATPSPRLCSVISVDRIPTMGVAFGHGNSWRGDQFGEVLIRKLEKLGVQFG